jgi:hypothetical protein
MIPQGHKMFQKLYLVPAFENSISELQQRWVYWVYTALCRGVLKITATENNLSSICPSQAQFF